MDEVSQGLASALAITRLVIASAGAACELRADVLADVLGAVERNIAHAVELLQRTS